MLTYSGFIRPVTLVHCLSGMVTSQGESVYYQICGCWYLAIGMLSGTGESLNDFSIINQE